MTLWKCAVNRFVTAAENIPPGTEHSKYHTGCRAFSRELLIATGKKPRATAARGFVQRT